MTPFSILFVFHYTINLHKQGMCCCFLVTDQLEKIHMLNQMGEINSFIKLILKLPVLQYHQGRHGFDCATVRIRTLKNVQ